MVDDTTPSDRRVIGQASMTEDGTVVLDLRMEDKRTGAIGDARVRYPRGDPNYQSTLDHLGGLQPGEIKPVYNDWN